jgi:SNF2 family DNA or RNA helicase
MSNVCHYFLFALAVCLRRTKNSELDGKPIISLPPRETNLVSVDFSPSEREFYESLEKKTLLRFNAYLKAGYVWTPSSVFEIQWLTI